MTPFEFPDLLGASWLDKGGPHSRLLQCQRKGDGKVGALLIGSFRIRNGSVARSVMKEMWLVC